MNTEILGVALQILLLIVISYPLGKHIAKVYKEGKIYLQTGGYQPQRRDGLEGIPEISAYYKRILVLLGYDPVGIARISSFES